jgi:hypothetical protein
MFGLWNQVDIDNIAIAVPILDIGRKAGISDNAPVSFRHEA